ncbi:aminotransferase class I/II-fold pyridoxal phosphate-dependent enzyme [Actinomadura sp. ATCC 31491]|uniref:8-amino-7-oxononanoate synthase n=1 Tax=Actinomadura luzonensis TaxID=2805427 RepID=A0ABT0GBJ3_9ACTN|nr:aminotransferase class I/II-fold pyridoxal phosphate-dependent enzyme [Actinomadura luzonensis]MCK2221978.1 aminotransferase class I/II-fold pyridoxal phosphate-dependent enzyme [Actinomadura luzonensis]
MTDAFAKCQLPPEAESLTSLRLYPFYRPVAERFGDGEVLVEGRRVLMAGSNDYLALAEHPRVKEAGVGALRRLGAGNSGSRVLNGTLALHEELEAELARFLGHEAAMVVTTGYQANLALAPLFGPRDVLYADRHAHASLIEAARLGGSPLRRFRHNDVAHLGEMLAADDPELGRLIVTEGMFSVTGDLCDLPAIAGLATAHGARLIVDSAHDLGLLGATGQGAGEQLGHQDTIDVQTLTFSKCLGTTGGAVAGPARIIGYLRHRARAALFSASLPAACAAAALASLRIVREEPERRRRVLEHARRLRDGLAGHGFTLPPGDTPTVPIEIGDPVTCCRFWTALLEEGVLANAMLPPAVPEGRSLIRVSVTAAHTEAQVDRLLEALATVADRLGPIAGRPGAVARV